MNFKRRKWYRHMALTWLREFLNLKNKHKHILINPHSNTLHQINHTRKTVTDIKILQYRHVMTAAPMWYGNIPSKDKSNFNHVKEMFTKWQFWTQLPPTSGFFFFLFLKHIQNSWTRHLSLALSFICLPHRMQKSSMGCKREKKKLAQFKSFQRISNQAPIKYPLTYTIYSTNILMINIYIYFHNVETYCF